MRICSNISSILLINIKKDLYFRVILLVCSKAMIGKLSIAERFVIS